MLRKLIKNKKAQNTAEYAILISLVVAGIIAMQTYAQRALQAKVRDASLYLATTSDGLDADGVTDSGDIFSGHLLGSTQYEPYYLKSDYDVDREDTTRQSLSDIQVYSEFDQGRNRRDGGYQSSSYNQAAVDGVDVTDF